jgi:hypothetical protein
VLDPALVVTLGRFSLGTFMPGTRISQVHGTIRPVDPETGAGDASVLALYHPAAADRSPDVKRQSFDDIGHAPRALEDSRARRAAVRGVAAAVDETADDSADGVMAVAAPVVGDALLEEAPPASDLTIF